MKKISSHWEVKYVQKNGQPTQQLVKTPVMPENVHFLGVRMERAKYTPFATVAHAFEAETKLSTTKSAVTRVLKATAEDDARKHLNSAEKNFALVEEAYNKAQESWEQEHSNDEMLDVALLAASNALMAARDAVARARVAVDAFTQVPDNGEDPDNGGSSDNGGTLDNGDEPDNSGSSDNGGTLDNGDEPDNGGTLNNGDEPDNGGSSDNGGTLDNGDEPDNSGSSDNSGSPDNVGDSTSEADELAKKHGLTPVDWTKFPIFVSDKGEFFVYVSGYFFSLADVTRESGEAFMGEKPVTGLYSPQDFKELLGSLGATIPTRKQFEEFVELLNRATGSKTAIGLMRALLGNVNVFVFSLHF